MSTEQPLYIEAWHIQPEFVDQAIDELRGLAMQMRFLGEKPTACQRIVYQMLKDAGIDFNQPPSKDK